MNNLQTLIHNLKLKGVLKSQNIENALNQVDRKDFVTSDNKTYAYIDNALSIGHQQTISQPYTAIFMLELLQPQEGEKILDAGSGSGWQAALLAHIVSTKGKVYAYEIVNELCAFGQENLAKHPNLAKRVTMQCKSAEQGVEKISETGDSIPLDKIIAAAELTKVPQKWRDQLKPNGIMVYPSDHGIYKETKLDEKNFQKDYFPGFVFVPFIHRKNS